MRDKWLNLGDWRLEIGRLRGNNLLISNLLISKNEKLFLDSYLDLALASKRLVGYGEERVDPARATHLRRSLPNRQAPD
jgi:hypothetical protein